MLEKCYADFKKLDYTQKQRSASFTLTLDSPFFANKDYYPSINVYL